MKFYAQLTILHQNIPFPKVETLCPFIWTSTEQWDSDGDHYFDDKHFFNNDPRYWSDLSVSIDDTSFDLFVYREVPGFAETTGNLDQRELAGHIEDFRRNTFADREKRVNLAEKLAVSCIRFSTRNLEHYRLMLETVRDFFTFTSGVMLDPVLLYPEEFEKEFLST